MNDADVKTARLREAADTLARIEAKGTCTHGHHQVRSDGTVTCLRCGRVWPTEEEAFTAHDEFLQ